MAQTLCVFHLHCTPDESNWWRKVFAGLRALREGQPSDEHEIPEMLVDAAVTAMQDHAFFPSLCAVLSNDCFRVTGHGSTNVDHLAVLLQAFLQDNRPTSSVNFEYAHVGDPNQPGSFGGGACLVTATSIEWISTAEWIKERSQ